MPILALAIAGIVAAYSLVTYVTFLLVKGDSVPGWYLWLLPGLFVSVLLFGLLATVARWLDAADRPPSAPGVAAVTPPPPPSPLPISAPRTAAATPPPPPPPSPLWSWPFAMFSLLPPLMVLILIALQIWITAPVTGQPRSEFRYGAIIDAGSGGSRLEIFEWHIASDGSPHVQTVALVKDKELDGKPECRLAKMKPGAPTCICLGKLTTRAREEAVRILGKPNFPPIPLWVKATAGVRTLNVPTQVEILHATDQCLSNTEGYEWRSAEVISGPKEGVFAWLAVNYLAKELQADGVADTLGIVEMGGQSAQIAYRIAGPNLPAPALGEIVTVPLAPKELNIYSVSHFLGNEAAIQDSSMKDLRINECAQYKNPQGCVDTKINPFLRSKVPVGNVVPDGFLKEDLSPPTNMRFAGLANFEHVVHNILGQESKGTLKEALDKANEICGPDDDNNNNKRQNMRLETFKNVDKDFKDLVCFNAFYATQLVKYGWNIPLGKVSPPVTGDPGWRLGAMIFEAVKITGAGPHR